MNYTKVEWAGIFRTFLTAAGAIFFGLNFFGKPVDEVLWQEIVGLLVAIFSTAWSFFDKTITLEGLQGVIRQMITFTGAIAVARGVLSPEKLLAIIGMITTLLPVVYGFLSRKKSNDLVNGKIQLHQLKK